MGRRILKSAALLAMGAILAAAIFAPGAESGAKPGLRLKTAIAEKTGLSPGTAKTATPRCGRGYHVVGGGYLTGGSSTVEVYRLEKASRRELWVSAANTGTTGSGYVQAQAICARGTGGLEIDDTVKRLPG